MPADASTSAATCLLGDAGYTVALTATGAGCSRWNGLAVTRWRMGDRGGEQGGYVYVRDTASRATWSATPLPCGGATRHWFDGAMARFARRDDTFTTTLEIAVDPGHPVEVRGVGIRNDGPVEREIELTSYLELILGSDQGDRSHPAYSKMFVQTALEDGVLLAWRRKKDPSDPDIWAAHALVVDGDERGARECETDRMHFIGRDGSLAAPAALVDGRSLSGAVGIVLDPVFSLRTRVAVGAGQRRRAAFVTAAGASRAEVLALIRRHLMPTACADVFARARAVARRSAMNLGIDAAEVDAFRDLSGALLGADPTWRADAATIAQAEGGAPVLWAKGISGDLPVVLLRLDDVAQVGLVKELLLAQRWWRARQLPSDLVILAGAANTDALEVALQDALGTAEQGGDKAQGSAFVLRETDLGPRLRNGLYAAASVVLDGRDGNLAKQIARRTRDTNASVAEVMPPRSLRVRGGKPDSMPSPKELEFWNGLGGFTQDGREYVTVLRDGAHTPVPWTQVVANAHFGFLATATGGGYGWTSNSQQNQITAWSNDAVRDPPGEVFLLRDADDGAEWSATASPVRAGGATYVARFGPGYARFDANVHGIASELTQCVAESDPVKISRLRLHNRSGRARRIAIAQLVTWMLGPIGSDTRATTQIESDPARSAVFARNAWREEFAQAVAFIACSTDGAAHGSDWNARSAVVATVDLAPDESTDLVFLLGEGVDRANAQALVERYRRADFEALLEDTRTLWDSVLAPLQIETPQRSIDLLVNHWLPYQVLACRVWARTAFYQASGAYGYRDQLQDVAALCVARPDIAREHILLSASRQFEEGDVQHWWLPPSGRGLRTRMVDDRLWLPFVVAHYIATTGDAAILDARVPFLRGDVLKPDQADAFFKPEKSSETANLFEHCARAIDASLGTGVHGLPLIGTGDWNDGMNRVGAGGKGESVWMGWFLIKVIGDFAPLAEDRRDLRAARWRDFARAQELALETKAWDGDWYRRAFYDDGTPLGSSVDTECRIESMAQSWAVISGRGDHERCERAMRAVNEHLVRSNDGVVALFTEPFDKTSHDPGYIKGYPPGLRENGGQYTHGSIWSLIAFAMLGDGDKVGELLEIFDPIRKSDTPEKLARYKVEPYVECADVYSAAPHVGRGGWTWYTGSAGWLYRAIVEWVLGFRLHGDLLKIDPCIPRAWKGFALTYRRGKASWRIEVENPQHVCRGIAAIQVDGVTLQDSGAGIALIDDGAAHHVHVTLHKEPS
ncbi:MAG TPA: glycosyl transferase family 36 [Rhodanobacteraceae bacterium]|nr:glycosyl transferase family 36 [Rhodanobacteraceae bacterium]